MLLKERWPWLLLGFCVFVSALYQYGYWSTFGLNIFEYFQIQDILKDFVFVLMSAGDPYMLQVVCITVVITNSTPSWANKVELEVAEDGTRHLRPTQHLNWHESIFVWLNNLPRTTPLIVSGIIASFLGGFAKIENYPNFLVTLCIALLAIAMSRSAIFSHLKWGRHKFILSYVVLLLSWHSLLGGRRSSLAIIKSDSFLYSVVPPGKKADYAADYLKYLGRTGDRFVFISPNNKTRYLVRQDEMAVLKLRQLNRPLRVQTPWQRLKGFLKLRNII